LERDILLSLLRLFHRKIARIVRRIRSIPLTTEQAMIQESTAGPGMIGATVGLEVSVGKVDELGGGADVLGSLRVAEDLVVEEVCVAEASTSWRLRRVRPA
jgi:hypothetical protein